MKGRRRAPTTTYVRTYVACSFKLPVPLAPLKGRKRRGGELSRLVIPTQLLFSMPGGTGGGGGEKQVRDTF